MSPLRGALRVLAFLCGLLLVGGVTFGVLGLAIPAGFLRLHAEEAATRVLGETVTFGELGIIPRLPPTLLATHVTIGESHGGAGDLLVASKLRVRLALLPLLRREIHLAEFAAEEIVVDLVAASSPLHVDRLDAVAREGEALRLSGSGTLGAQPMQWVLEGGPLSDLVAGDSAWPFEGRVEAGNLAVGATGSIDRSRGEDCLDLTLRSDTLDSGDLARRLGRDAPISGSLEDIQLTALAPCEQSNELLDALRLEFSVAGGNLHLADPELTAEIGRFAARYSAAAGLSATAGLSLEGQSLTVELETPPRESDEPWPFRATLDGAGAHLGVGGVLEPERDAGHIEFELGGARAGDLAGWLGVDPDSEAAYRARGRLTLDPAGWELLLSQIRLGQSAARASLSSSVRSPPLVGELAIETLAPSELSELFARESNTDGAPGSAPFRLEDADLKLSIARLLGAWSTVSNVEVRLAAREGRLGGSVAALIGGMPFHGDARIDDSDDIPRAALDLSAENVDVGTLLSEIGLARGVVARADRLNAQWRGAGTTLAKLLGTSRLEAELHEATWEILDSASAKRAAVHVSRGQLHAAPGRPTRLDLEGEWSGVPAQLRLETAPLAELASNSDAIDMKLTGRTQQSEFELSLHTALPLERRELGGAFEIRGARLGALEPLLGVGLPPLGRYSAHGLLEIDADSYSLHEATIRIGESELRGEGTLETAGTRPRLDVRLHADHLQLDDLTPPPADEQAGDWGDLDFLAPESLGRLDADVAIQVDRLSLGPDPLGSGRLHVLLEAGTLSIDPLDLHVAAGDATLTAHCRPVEGELRCEVVASAPELDYGVMARRADPTTDKRGLLSFEADLSSLAPSAKYPLAHANGKIGFLVVPERLRAGVLDTFTVNLFFAVLPLLGITQSSVNCVVGDFELEDGVLRPETLILDTTTTRVRGEGTVDFRRQWVDLVLRPLAKRARLLSLETTVVVDGHFSDFQFDVPPDSLVGSAFHLATSLVTAPLQWLSGKPPPADGKDVCGERRSLP